MRPQGTGRAASSCPVSCPGFSSGMAVWPAHRVCTRGRSLAGSAGLPLLDRDSDPATGWAEKRTPTPTNPHAEWNPSLYPKRHGPGEPQGTGGHARTACAASSCTAGLEMEAFMQLSTEPARTPLP